jgi:hypothetical protein
VHISFASILPLSKEIYAVPTVSAQTKKEIEYILNVYEDKGHNMTNLEAIVKNYMPQTAPNVTKKLALVPEAEKMEATATEAPIPMMHQQPTSLKPSLSTNHRRKTSSFAPLLASPSSPAFLTN